MSSSSNVTAVYTKISTAIQDKDTTELFLALSDRFSLKAIPLTEQELADPIYQTALSYVAEYTHRT